jgi:hypothetical protein
MVGVSEPELVDLITHALQRSGLPDNAERIDVVFAVARARHIVRELVGREGIVFSRPSATADAAPASRQAAC